MRALINLSPRRTFQRVLPCCLVTALILTGCQHSAANHPPAKDAAADASVEVRASVDAPASAGDVVSLVDADLSAPDLPSPVVPDGAPDLPATFADGATDTPSDLGAERALADGIAPDVRLTIDGPAGVDASVPSPGFDPSVCAGAMQMVYVSQPQELMPGTGDLAARAGKLFVGHSSSGYSWVFSIPETGGDKNLLYEGHVLSWWLEDDQLVYAQPYDLFSMPQAGGPPISILHYGDKAYDQLGGLSLGDRNLDRNAIYWLFFDNSITIRRHLRSGGEDEVLATLAASDVSNRFDSAMMQSKDDLLVSLWGDTAGSYVAAIPKAGGTLQALPVPAGRAKLLAASRAGGMLWTIRSYSPGANEGLLVANLDGTKPQPFPRDFPRNLQPIHAWPAGHDAWYIAASEKDAQGALYLSIWYVEASGASRRLACDPRGHLPSLGESNPVPEATTSAGMAGDGRFYVSIGYPEGSWVIARLDNPGASPDLTDTDTAVDGGATSTDSAADAQGGSCPVVTGDGSVQGESGQNVFTEFPVPTAGGVPQSIAAGPDGNVWFAEIQKAKLGKITPSGCITEYELNSWANSLVSGPDSNLWFTQPAQGLVAHIATDGMLYRSFDIPRVTSPQGMTLGSDGNLWFADNGGSQVGRITPQGDATLFAPPGVLSTPVYIASEAQGLIWFYENTTKKLASIDPTSGAINEVSIPSVGSVGVMARGPDGAVWFVNRRSSATSIARINADGTLTDFSFPSGRNPVAMTSGPDGNLWIAEYDNNAIARLSPTTGEISEFAIPTPASLPMGVTAGADGNIWFTEGHANQIGRLTL